MSASPVEEIAEEACRLQRRGRTWYLIPLGPKGSIRLYDQALDGPCLLPFDVPFRIGGSCLTLRRSRSTDPDWEMYQTPSPADSIWPEAPSLVRPLPGDSMPTDTAFLRASQPQIGLANSSEISSPTRLEPTLKQSDGSTLVNPWEARWKTAGARLLAASERSKRPDTPQPTRALDGYLSVPLKEPSLAPIRPAKVPLGSTSLWGSDSHLLGTAGSVDPVAPPVASSTKSASSPERPRTQRSEPRQVIPGWHKPEKQHDNSGRSDLSPPEVSGKRIRNNPASWQKSTTSRVVKVEEVKLRASKPEAGTSSAHFPSESLEKYLYPGYQAPFEDRTLSKLNEVASSLTLQVSTHLEPIAQEEFIASEEAKPSAPLSQPRELSEAFSAGSAEDLAWSTMPLQYFMADTSWPNPVSLLENAVCPMFASAMGEVSANPDLRQNTNPSPNIFRPKEVRTATLLDSEAMQVRDRLSPSEGGVQPVGSSPRTARKMDTTRSGMEMLLPSAKDILAAAPRRPSGQFGKHPGQFLQGEAAPTVAQTPGEWSLPIWLAWTPAALFVLITGISGVLLSTYWSTDPAMSWWWAQLAPQHSHRVSA